jgi:DNA polymerase III epsilon subunit family exonuclease
MLPRVQLRFDSADRLVELVEERRGPVSAEEAARVLFALDRLPQGLAWTLLDDVVSGDARLAWRGSAVALAAAPAEGGLLEHASFAVVDLETTGLSPGRSRICEIGAVRVERLELEATFQTFADPREPLPAAVAALTGIDERDLRGAPSPAAATRRFVEFARDAVVVAHNARFDLGFLDHELERATGRRYAGPVVDTVWLARTLLAGRTRSVSLASLSNFFGTGARPCHRALPDAEATAEILLRLIGLAQERGARTVGDLAALAVPRTRAVHARRNLAFGAPSTPGVYLFRDAHDRVLYVGRARDLRARLRSYFRSEKQRPAVEAALLATERIEWRELGSELEAAFEELRLLRELRPPANARSTRPDRYVYLGVRDDRVVVTTKPTPHGPVRSRRRAELAARALEPPELERPATAVPRLRRKLAMYADALRYEDAARLRDRIPAVEGLAAELARLDRLRRAELCLLVPARHPAHRRAYFLTAGKVAAVRAVPPGPGGALELATGLAQARRTEPSLAPEDADDLALVAQFLRRPPPELEILTFDDLENTRRVA